MLSQSPGLSATLGRRLALTPGLRRQIDLVVLDAAALEQHLQQLFGPREDIRLVSSQAHCVERLFPARAAPPALTLPGGQAAEIARARGDGLIAHVEAQIGLVFRTPRARAIAAGFLPWLAPTGWLEADLDEILPALAPEFPGLTQPELAAVLARLQEVEPAGLFARSLEECLRLQAADQGLLDPPMQAVLANLSLLARGDLGGLAQLAGVSEAVIALRLRAIRGMDPKPGLRFGDDAPPPPEPDLMIRRGASGWVAALNPRLKSEVVAIRTSGRREASEASALLGFRGSALLRAGRWFAAEQPDWLEQGMPALRPVTRRSLALALELHETTVGRALRHRLVQTPRGMFLLDRLFGAAPARLARSGDGAAGTAPQAVLLRLKALIAAEPPEAPLDDAALAGLLAVSGVPMARRTVAKYRGQLGLGPAHARRRENR